MTATWTLLTLAGDVVLMLWGMHMVHNGIVRAYGSSLRRLLGRTLRNRFLAMSAGVAITVLLQSSTATSLMAASFAAQGALDLIPGLAVMLGANLGTTLVVQALSFDASKIVPLLLLAGFVAFKRGNKRGGRDLGRVGLGLGIMLLSLHLLGLALEPVVGAPALRALLADLTGDPILDLVIAAALTWAAHSSVAVVLLVGQLASSGVLPPPAALAFVLGANLGSTLPAVLSAGRDPVARRLPMGNGLIRLLGCVVAVPLLGEVARLGALIQLDPLRLVADFHTAFNLVLAGAFILQLGPIARLLNRALPDKPKAVDPATPLYLDESALDTPHLALGNTTREILRIADAIEAMLRVAQDAVLSPDFPGAAKLSGMGKTIDRLLEAVRAYIARISEDAVDEENSRRRYRLLALTVSLGHAADVIEHGLAESGFRRLRSRIILPAAEIDAARSLFAMLLSSLRLALATFMANDAQSAQALLDAKRRFNECHHALTTQHLSRLRSNAAPGGLDASSLYLAVLRDLKRVDSHFAAIAYPVLEGMPEMSSLLGEEATA